MSQPTPGTIEHAVWLENRGELDRSLKAFDAVLGRQPASATALARRGGVHFKLGDNQAALVDFDRAVTLEPRLGPQLWQRGISLYYAERWDDCVAQFVSHRTVNPNDVENAAWHYLCVARRDGVEAAQDEILPVGPDQRVPMKAVFALYRGDAGPDQVLATARKRSIGPLAHRLFYAHLYLGLWHEVHARPDQALEHLQRAHELQFPHYMGDVARVHLLSLEARTQKEPE